MVTMVSRPGPRYKVQYQLQGQHAVINSDYIMPGRKELLDHMRKMEGVEPNKTNFFYVHEHRTDGTVAVVMEWEDPEWFKSKQLGKATPEKCNLPVVYNQPKPLPLQEEATIVTLGFGRVVAQEAL